MSKVKKILAVVLSMAMVLGMSMTTFAAENTDVNVSVTGIGFDRTQDTATAKYLQIVEPNTQSTDGYSIIGAYADYFGDTTVADLIDIAKGETPANANATAGVLNSNSELSAILQKIATDEAANMVDAANASFNATSGGLYLITASRTNYEYSPMLVYVPVNSQEAIIVTAKGSDIVIEKEVAEDGQSIAQGDIVDYTIDSQYPFYSAQYPEENVIYTIKDTLTNATHNPDSLKVYINDVLATDNDYTVDYNDDNNEFTIKFNYSRAKAGAAVRVEYNVTVGVVEVGSPLTNIAEKNTSTDEGQPITRTRNIVTSNPVAFTFAKVDAQTLDALGGATFDLYERVDGADDKLIAGNVTGTENGIFSFDGLDAQKSYYVVETDAPDGYSLNDTKYDLTRSTDGDDILETGPESVEDADGVTATVFSTTYVFDDDFHVNRDTDNVDEILNTTLSSLPSTGGIGTTIFTIGGCIIMIGAAFLYFRSRKKVQ